MNTTKFEQSLANLQRAMNRLQEALQEDSGNSLVIDGTIQRFEFVLELFWKTLKRYLLQEGIDTKTPRETLKAAYATQLIDDETLWLSMLESRNTTSHIYDERQALKIYHNIQQYFPALQTTFKKLQN